MLRLLQGLAFGGLTPIIITSVGDIYDGTEEATGQGIRFTTSGLASACFPVVAGILVIIGWEYPFFLYALAYPIAIVVYMWFDEPTEGDTNGTALPETDGVRTHLHRLVRFAARREVLAIVIARALPMAVWIGFLTYNSIIVIRVLGGTATQAGLLTAVGSLVLAIAASQAGRITIMFSSQLYPFIGANICLGVEFAVFVLAPSLMVAGIGIAIVGLGVGLTLAIYRSIITGLASDSLRGGLVSLSEAFGRTVATITPILMGGVIAVIVPHVGFGPALHVASLGIAFVSSVGGVGCLLVAHRPARGHSAM